ncbi:DUF6318 family protein [Isoptericola sp. NPDC057653]|uniref:DUF6318 family protein n=1 Tax=Isoptericola sp. NPDC057653 TaxID=3346195 RepID=UPI0036BFAEEF
MTRTRAILAATSIAAAAVLLVAGCDGDEAAKPSPEPTATSAGPESSPSPSPTATVAAPERPQALDDDGPAGAEAAAVYFLELDDYIMKTGDTAEWEAMSQKSCEYCANRLDQANEIAERGDVFSGGEAEVRVTHTYAQDQATGLWPLDVTVSEAPTTITDSNGKQLFEQGATRSESRVEVSQKNGRWVIVNVAEKPGS